MNNILCIIGGRAIPQYSVFFTLAVVMSIIFFLVLYLQGKGSSVGAMTVVPSALFFGILFSRLIHWYCRTNSYPGGLITALTDYSVGGYALIGAFAGCLLAIFLARAVGSVPSVPDLLDPMAVAGCLGICIGRFAMFFAEGDRGQLLKSAPALLAKICAVTNSVSGSTEYRFPTFFVQGLLTGILFLVLLFFSYMGTGRKRGDIFLLFLLFYSTGQILLDSTRRDSLYFRSNGFVSIVQIFSLLAILFTIAVFSLRLIRECGFQRRCIPLWIGIALCLGGAGFMEYYVQRHSTQALISYCIMSVFLIASLVQSLVLCWSVPYDYGDEEDE